MIRGWKHIPTGIYYDIQTHPHERDWIVARFGGTAAEYELIDAISPDEMPINLEAQRAIWLKIWNTRVNQFICQYFDLGTQLSLLVQYARYQKARAEASMTPDDATQEARLEEIDAWKNAVLQYYYTRKALLQSAATLEELRAIYTESEFAPRFGTSGSVMAVPQIHLSELV